MSSPPGALKQLKKLDGATRREILGYLETRIAPVADPKQFGRARTHDLSGLWRYRVGGLAHRMHFSSETPGRAGGESGAPP